jgi:hypothetical protein
MTVVKHEGMTLVAETPHQIGRSMRHHQKAGTQT